MKQLKIIFFAIITLIIVTFFIRLCSDDYIEPIVSTEAMVDSLTQSEVKRVQFDNTTTNTNILEYYDTLHFEIPRLIDTRAEQSLIRKGYTCSYNQDTRNANWVAWHLTKEHTDGPWSRKGLPYIEDSEVIGTKQELDDWYDHDLEIDHGHMCPAGDNKWDKDAMIETFLLTNMCPQNSNLNRGIWENLESRCRGWARHYGEVYITTGPIFYSENYETIGANKVGVPDAFYKVVLCLTKKPKALGFIFPNAEPEYDNIKDYMYSVDEVENITKIDFFYNIEDSIENIIEASSNLNNW